MVSRAVMIVFSHVKAIFLLNGVVGHVMAFSLTGYTAGVDSVMATAFPGTSVNCVVLLSSCLVSRCLFLVVLIGFP